jgi:hypothetical protein
MIRKILSIIGIGASASTLYAGALHKPYKEESTNLIYNLLFCDDIKLFKENTADTVQGPLRTLLADSLDLDGIAKLAKSNDSESRIKILAYRLLAKNNKRVPNKKLLGVIVEVQTNGGLDTLAIFEDGSVRYINYTEKMSIIEGVHKELKPNISQVFEVSQPIIEQIGPWNKDRLMAPQAGNIRLTFLCSDGLYFGEGPMNIMQNEPMAKPLIMAATMLLQKVTDLSIK